MTFKELKPSYSVYILRKGNNVSAEVGRVVSASMPYLNTSNGSTQMVVDITISSENGGEAKYCIPESQTVAKANDNLFLFTDVDAMIREVSMIRLQSESAIKSIETHEQIVADCKEIEETFDPSVKAKRENDKRMELLENAILDIQKQLKVIAK